MSKESITAAPSNGFRWTQLIIGVICMAMIANLQYGWTYFVGPMSKANSWDVGGIQVIDYRVALNMRQKLADVKIEGNHFFDTDTLREHLDIAPAKFLRYRFGRYSQKLLDQDLNAVRDLYRSNGFRGVDVTARRIRPGPTGCRARAYRAPVRPACRRPWPARCR